MNLLYSAAAALGIKLSSKIIGFISEELTKEERENQKQTEKKYYEFLQNAKKNMEIYIAEKTQQNNEIVDFEINKLIEEQKKKIVSEIKSDIIGLLKEKANDRKNYVDETFIPELNSSEERLLKMIKHDQNTTMRLNALNILKEEIGDIKNRTKAYSNYLKTYINMLDKIYDANIYLDENQQDMIFSYKLPAKWTYNGSIIYVSRKDIMNKNGICYFLFHNAIKRKFYVEDYKKIQDCNRDSIPLFQKCYDNKIKCNVYSFTVGEYLDINRLGAYNGIPVAIDKYIDRKTINVKYRDSLDLTLEVKNLTNYTHFPPPGAEIIVYPYKKKLINKKWTFYVSQRPEDVQISLWFDKITLLLPLHKTKEFLDYWKTNNLSDQCMDTKIAPYLQNYHKEIEKVKIQFGEEYIILANIKYIEESNSNILEFESFLEMDERIRPEDIFVPFNAEINVVLPTDLDYYSDNVSWDSNNNLVITLFKEFRRQFLLKNSNGGTRYFNTWEVITGKLKECLEKGDSLNCEIEGIPDQVKGTFGITLKYSVKNREELLAFFKKHNYLDNRKNGYIEFFVEYYGIRLYVNIVYMKQHDIELLVPGMLVDNINIDDLILKSEITIIKQENAIPEQRQLWALHQYKIGALSNPDLHAFILNAQNIYSERIQIGEIDLFNNQLKNDISQYNALLTCLQEKNFFMIQGPPGTGKTTVIRELIYQTIKRNPEARVLIVSQANVAVDNVIRGLSDMNISTNSVIRCGRSEKIQPDIVKYSYEKKYNDYLNKLSQRTLENGPIADLSNRWQKIIGQKNHEIEIGELIIGSHSIIGATCIGLGQKKIGIDKIEFDIVIIDESAKALAPELIMPVIKAKKLIMIGDHKQLPPVINPVLYDEEKIEIDNRKYCKNVLFQQSLFERLFSLCPETNKTSLNIQYRMPKLIGDLINQVFYNNALKNGENTLYKSPIFFNSSINLIDMSLEHRYHENDSCGSPYNDYEADYVIDLLKRIRSKDSACKIAVITPYKGQKYNIKKRFINDPKCNSYQNIIIDTIDSFQGDESNIVIFCTTRSRKKTLFFQDKKRLNVALSRAQNELIIICSSKYFNSYEANTPVRKVLDYIEKYGTKQQVIPLNNKTSNYNKEIVELNNIYLEEYSNYDEKLINREKNIYLNKGRFSLSPKVYKRNDKYILTEYFEIYYAAVSLSVKEIEVRLH